MPGPQTFRGVVTAAKRMPKTITVTVSRTKIHPIVGKPQKRRTRMLTHDDQNQADVGDTVLIRNCPPKSAAKRHELVEIITKARKVAGITQGLTMDESHATLADAKAEVQHHSPSNPSS
ncbi:nucleic acid-binding protein [Cystobasidium minutum MCA 4210]|uniref:mitochondrial 37S ribosomal protein uS17m n=1 Tax=Cystobasidium minutum MCA 4210 TaxID=1397322 RepID=UPI0034CF47D2|eukprot:jgi/Rhomi1/166398/fgenesh1_kg.1_\